MESSISPARERLTMRTNDVLASFFALCLSSHGVPSRIVATPVSIPQPRPQSKTAGGKSRAGA